MKIPRLFISIGFVIGLTCCSQAPQEAIVGKWQNRERPLDTFEFLEDGTLMIRLGAIAQAKTIDGEVVTQGGPDKPTENKYSFLDDGRLAVTFAEGPLFSGRKATFGIQFSLSGDEVNLKNVAAELNLGDSDGILRLRRVE